MLGRLQVLHRYHRKMGRFPELRNPTKFSEKVQVAKLEWRSPLMPVLADKVLAKEVVAEKLGADWVTPTLFSGPWLPPLKERNWPRPYVIKANHRCGANHFVRHADDEDWRTIEAKFRSWMKRPYGQSQQEWAYSRIRPQILVEPVIGSGSAPVDYKLFVFGGRVEFIQIHTDRFADHKCAFYDREWRQQPFALNWPRDPRPHPRPASLDQMIEGAETLAEGFSFVRIDLYEIDGKPRFGEVTFYPESGLATFEPPELDDLLGSLWPGRD